MSKKAKTTVNVDAVKRDVKKFTKEFAQNTPPAQSHAELSAGTVNRQSPLEQDMGSRKYRDMIHGHNSKNKHILDRLPFTFPPKKKIRSHLSVSLACPECGAGSWGSEYTVGFICKGCNKFVKPINQEAESRGYDPTLNVGIFGTASDKLDLLMKKDKKNA
jgi:hypothetical protein